MMSSWYGQNLRPWSYYGNGGYGPVVWSGGFGPGFGAGFGWPTPGQLGGFGPNAWPWLGAYGAYPFAGGFGASPAFGWIPTNDEELRDFVENAIENDPTIPPNANINVEVRNGVVTLTGTVPNKRIKHAAGDDAWWLPQVVDVHNEITVTPRRERAGATVSPTERAGGRRS